MKKAMWNGKVIAESDKTVDLYGVTYFPKSSCKMEFFKKSDHTSICPWKGEAIYFSIAVDSELNENAAWSYPKAASDRAKHIENHVAFWNGVEVKDWSADPLFEDSGLCDLSQVVIEEEATQNQD